MLCGPACSGADVVVVVVAVSWTPAMGCCALVHLLDFWMFPRTLKTEVRSGLLAEALQHWTRGEIQTFVALSALSSNLSVLSDHQPAFMTGHGVTWWPLRDATFPGFLRAAGRPGGGLPEGDWGLPSPGAQKPLQLRRCARWVKGDRCWHVGWLCNSVDEWDYDGAWLTC